ncbi:hypothetical protein E4U60_005597 [Claviceps pazoutovae]|uniref:Uncharacterized protein n=1 Tax=Claviceps pazoutovae TaxID=1649127 RepID=A0A9P7MK42_9HYPO|nr:hypothetical protein E4U60_005597 [Claviceps pazoutovae]
MANDAFNTTTAGTAPTPVVHEDVHKLIRQWYSAHEFISSLTGAENYQTWESSVKLHARGMRLMGHLSGDIPYSPETDEHHFALKFIIWQSLSSRVRKDLLHTGWNLTMPAPETMRLVRIACGYDPDMFLIDLLQKFFNSNRSAFSTMQAWFIHHESLWAQINNIEKVSESLWVAQTINVLEEGVPEVYGSWRSSVFDKALLTKKAMLPFLADMANDPRQNER